MVHSERPETFGDIRGSLRRSTAGHGRRPLVGAVGDVVSVNRGRTGEMFPGGYRGRRTEARRKSPWDGSGGDGHVSCGMIATGRRRRRATNRHAWRWDGSCGAGAPGLAVVSRGSAEAGKGRSTVRTGLGGAGKSSPRVPRGRWRWRAEARHGSRGGWSACGTA